MTINRSAPVTMTRPATIAVTGAAIATLLLAVLDSNIVTTAAVPIARDLRATGGASQVPWLVTAYLLAGTVVQPLYGKLCDILGVRPVFLASVGVFVVGSVLCGLSTSMPELIGFRAFQGLGGGGLMSVAMVVLGHLRAENPDSGGSNGNTAAGVMVGLGLVCAPLLGGTLISHLDWRWIFFINLPLGIAAWLIMARWLRLGHTPVREPLDALSGLLLGAAGALLLLACEWGGRRLAWLSPAELTLFAGAVLLAAGFAWRQGHSAAPFFPPRLLAHPVLRIVTVLQIATGLGMAAGTVYIVMELQLVHGYSPIGTGLALIPEAIGLAAGAAAGGLLLRRRRPLRTSVVVGTALTALAMAGMATSTVETPIGALGVLLLVFGAGVGLTLGNEVIIVQSSVQQADLGMATTGVRFVESLGTSLGAAAFGALFTAVVGTHDISGSRALIGGLDLVFAVGASVLAVATLAALRLPKGALGVPQPARP